MATIPDEVLQRVRDAHDIVEVVQRTLELKRTGPAWKACCPFHEEKTPSFQVNPRLQIFKCFGCGKGGNVFHWLMEARGLTFREAVQMLAEERSIEVPLAGGARDASSRDERREIARALSFAERWFQHTLATDAGTEARAYLARRGYGEAEIKRFGLGFAPPAWDGLVQSAAKRGLDGRLLAAAGVAKTRPRGDGWYDAFRHRIVFPIRDAQGTLVTFAGRTLDPAEAAKYLNGPETAVFSKARTLYALDRARDTLRKSGEALLLEGYTDVLMCHVHGLEGAVAGMGTALSEGQGRLLARFAERVVLLYDGDAAGQAAAERAIDVLLPTGLQVRVATLPADRDVDEILLEEGRAGVDAILGNAKDWFEHRYDLEAGRHDLTDPRGRSRAAEVLLRPILLLTNELERQQRLRDLAERLGGDLNGVGAEEALRRMAAARRSPRPAPSAAAPGQARAPGPGGSRGEDRRRIEADCLAAVLAGGALRDLVLRAIGPEEVLDPALQRLFHVVLDLTEVGAVVDAAIVAARLPEDRAALEALADLPDDATLADRVEAHVAFLERRRHGNERREHLAASLRAAALGLALPASGRQAASARPAAPAPPMPPARESAAPAAAQPAEPRRRPVGRPTPPAAARPDLQADSPSRAGPHEANEEFASAFDPPVLDGPGSADDAEWRRAMAESSDAEAGDEVAQRPSAGRSRTPAADSTRPTLPTNDDPPSLSFHDAGLPEPAS